MKCTYCPNEAVRDGACDWCYHEQRDRLAAGKPPLKPAGPMCPVCKVPVTEGDLCPGCRVDMARCDLCGEYGYHDNACPALRVACAECGDLVNPLTVFPGGRCLECWRPIGDAEARTMTAEKLTAMWGR